MAELLTLYTPSELAVWQQASGVPLLDAVMLQQHAPNAHLLLTEPEHVPARCSLWWEHVPALPPSRVGLIGHYAALDHAAGVALLRYACAVLARQGCTIGIGPMDGNTWRAYRLVTERGSLPPFFLEPSNPDDWPQHFLAAGMQPLATYHSALNTDLSQQDPRVARVAERLAAQGVTIRHLDMPRFEAELSQIHALSALSFAPNFLYTPLVWQEFLAQYLPIQGYITPDLVLIAEHESNVVGFLFALPDHLQTQRGEPLDTIIIKTVAIAPGRAYAGLGAWLAARVHAVAHRLGFRRAINALMHDANVSARLSARYGDVVRRYTLYAKDLPSPLPPGEGFITG